MASRLPSYYGQLASFSTRIAEAMLAFCKRAGFATHCYDAIGVFMSISNSEIAGIATLI
jgi:hypothetical protein